MSVLFALFVLFVFILAFLFIIYFSLFLFSSVLCIFIVYYPVFCTVAGLL